jgi:hypothetical protein
MNITELVKGNKVKFDSYRAGFFYYTVGYMPRVGMITRYETYQFPIPIEDIGNATLLAEDKAITFMRWIRKAMEDNTLIKIK